MIPRPSAYTEALCRAANAVGGADVLAQRLQVDIPRLRRWMRGDENPPTEVFLRAVDLIEKQAPGNSAEPPPH